MLKTIAKNVQLENILRPALASYENPRWNNCNVQVNKYNVGSVGPSEGVGDCVQSPRLLALITSLSALMLQVFVMPLFALIGLTVVPCLRMFCVFARPLFALGLTVVPCLRMFCVFVRPLFAFGLTVVP